MATGTKSTGTQLRKIAKGAPAAVAGTNDVSRWTNALYERIPRQVTGEIDESRLRKPLRAGAGEASTAALCDQRYCRPVRLCPPGWTRSDSYASLSVRRNDWQTEVRKEWVAPFDASREPLVRLVWLRGEKVHEFILAGHHCICDGDSGINLLRECLSVYDQPEHDLDAYDVLGGVEILYPRVCWRASASGTACSGKLACSGWLFR